MRLPWLVLVLATACANDDRRTELTEEALNDPATRREVFEITLRALDDNPRYADELFEMAWRHPALDRLLRNTAESVEAGEMAERVARQLVRHPPGLRRVIIEAFTAAQDRPDAQLALVSALESEVQATRAYLAEHPEKDAAVRETLCRTRQQETTMQTSRR